jgi:hypothetical protein
MFTIRRDAREARGERRPVLHIVRAGGLRRPPWTVLYLGLLLTVGGGGVGTWWAQTDGERNLIAGLMCLAFLMVAAFWVRCNRVALHRLAEPADGRGRLGFRVVLSRTPRPALRDGRIVRLEPGQPVPVFPGDAPPVGDLPHRIQAVRRGALR